MDHKQGASQLERSPLSLLFFVGILASSAAAYFSFDARADVIIMNGGSVSVTAIVPPAALAFPAIPPPPPLISPGPSGGGGGGGGNTPNPFFLRPVENLNDAVFQGTAYPGSIVTLLKNGVVAAEVPASPDASFKITLSGLVADTYNFGVRAEDTDGRRSAVQVYTVSMTAGVTTLINGIFLPPTIGADKLRAKRGDVITFFGSAPPAASVSTIVHSQSEIVKKILADANGRWIYRLDTLLLENGAHEIRVRGETASDTSPFSQTLSFALGNGIVPDISLPKDVSAVDVNGDSRINLTDFSILSYWFHRPSPPANVDENHDGKVDLTDLSILAYYWTG